MSFLFQQLCLHLWQEKLYFDRKDILYRAKFYFTWDLYISSFPRLCRIYCEKMILSWTVPLRSAIWKEVFFWERKNEKKDIENKQSYLQGERLNIGRVFLVLRKKWLPSVSYCTHVHWTSHFFRGIRKHGHVKLVTLYL